jgi:hypothetical protein
MPTAKAARPPKQTVVGQWNIFGECVEIPINLPSPARKPATPPTPVPSATARPTIQTMIPAARKAAMPPAPDMQDLDFPLPGQRFDDGTVVDLEANDPDDTVETKLAKRMFLRMICDLTPKPEPVASHDLFGQASTSSQSEQDQLDALVWMYSLNPEPALVPFEWVCDVLSFDPHRVRRITGRSMRRELKRLVNLLSTIVGPDHARLCEETLSDYVNVSAWNLN